MIFYILFFRSKGKDSEYENVDSDVEPSAVFVGSSQIDSKQLQLPVAKPRSLSEQKDIDDFEKEERRIISEESSQVKKKAFKNYIVQIHVNFLIDLFFLFYL